MAKMKTREKYIEELLEKNSNIEVIGKYIGGHVPILHKCKVDGHEWLASPSSILNGRRCPECARRSRIVLLTKSHEQYIDELNQIFPQIKILEEYKASRAKALHQCTICNNIWYVKPDQLLQGKGCPVCSGRVVGPAPEYKNSIWSSEYKDFFSKYLTQEQMQQFTPHSGKKIKIKCPDCGNMKEIRVSDMCNRGFSCMCQDGQSYPNKFVFNVLAQLNIDIIPEYSSQWAKDKRYDIYVHEYNMIIENHGLQHYKECQFGRTLEEEQINDKHKYNIAISNGIDEYIILDCRRSDMNWIKKTIMTSSLPQIFNFDESDIDWISAAKYATSNLKKCAADLFNSGYNINQIADILCKESTSIRNWLKESTDLGWCNYVPQDLRDPVYCVELNTCFESMSSAHQLTGIRLNSIGNCCKGKQEYATTHSKPDQKFHWLYINDAIAQGFVV